MKSKFTILIFFITIIGLNAQVGNYLDLSSSKNARVKVSPAFNKVWGKGDKTVCFWVKDAVPRAMLLRFGGSDSSKPRTTTKFCIAVNAIGRIKFNDHLEGTAPLEHLIDITDGKWHHIAMTCKGNVCTLYVDGVGIKSVKHQHNVTIRKDWVIGYGFNHGSSSMAKFDNLTIWNTALTKEQIEKVKTAYLTKQKVDHFVDQIPDVEWKDLVLFYNFTQLNEEGEVTDLSRYNHSGVLLDGAKLASNNNEKSTSMGGDREDKLECNVSFNDGVFCWTVQDESRIKAYRLIDDSGKLLTADIEAVAADEYSLSFKNEPVLEVLLKSGKIIKVENK